MNRDQMLKRVRSYLTGPPISPDAAEAMLAMLIDIGAVRPEQSGALAGDEFDRLSERDQQATIENMSLPADYREPGKWQEDLRRAFLSDANGPVLSQGMADLIYQLIANLDLGRWEIISHVPERHDPSGDYIREIGRALREISVQNPAHKKLNDLVAEIVRGAELQQAQPAAPVDTPERKKYLR